MPAILGIDAAWTETEPSGVALIEGDGSTWRSVAVAPSYKAFISRAEGVEVSWRGPKCKGSRPSVTEVIAAARELAGSEVLIVALDMPVARQPFETRRAADSAISRAFGSRGCSAHSPNASRPGRLGAELMAELESQGFPLATAGELGAAPATIEVYPHPALLMLLASDYRVPYKVSRSSKYWKGASVKDRIDKLLHQFRRIEGALQKELGPIGFELPDGESVNRLSELKRFEDALDSLVCAWVGSRFSVGEATAYGDGNAAIWVPRVALPSNTGGLDGAGRRATDSN